VHAAKEAYSAGLSLPHAAKEGSLSRMPQRNAKACKGTQAANLDVLKTSVGGNM